MQVINKEEVKKRIEQAYETITTFDIELIPPYSKTLFDTIDILQLFPTDICKMIVDMTNISIIKVNTKLSYVMTFYNIIINDDRTKPISNVIHVFNKKINSIQLQYKNSNKTASFLIIDNHYLKHIEDYSSNDIIIDNMKCVIELFLSVFL